MLTRIRNYFQNKSTSRQSSQEKLEKLKQILDKSVVHKSDSFTEIFSNCYLSGWEAATDLKLLKSLGITAVLNAAQGKSVFSEVDTNQEFYIDAGIKYLGFKLHDAENVNIERHFDEGTRFIHESIDNTSKPGKIFVNCYMGMSRSATFVIAYLMVYRQMSLEDAIRLCASKRWVGPNDGFLLQLINLEKRLEKKKNKSKNNN